MGYTLKNSITKLARMTSQNIIPASIKGLKLYRNLRTLLLAHDDIYDAEYYERDVEAAAVQSSDSISNSILLQFNPKSVVDVGCGTGAILAAFREKGCHVDGLEYSEAALDYCRRRGLEITKFNIEQDDITTVLMGQKYDVAISLEVAEHLPENIADRYVALLCRLAPIIVMSAAQPGQGGTDHVNEQPHSYWVEKFGTHKFMLDEKITNKFAEIWSAGRAASFYYENVMVFCREKALAI
jgi:2-polyprenyl-3-methyl-5-hydroxy-6-metoxy-1,4-benzoquinol methylase